MQQYDWYEVLNKNFVSNYEYFFNILHSALAKHSPMSTLPKRRTNIYLTNETIRLKNAKTVHGKDTYPLELMMTGSLTSDSKTNCVILPET